MVANPICDRTSRPLPSPSYLCFTKLPIPFVIGNGIAMGILMDLQQFSCPHWVHCSLGEQKLGAMGSRGEEGRAWGMGVSGNC